MLLAQYMRDEELVRRIAFCNISKYYLKMAAYKHIYLAALGNPIVAKNVVIDKKDRHVIVKLNNTLKAKNGYRPINIRRFQATL